MGTRLAKQLTYDAPADAVAAMLDDVAFREAVLERQRVVRGSVDIDGDVARIEQVRSADDIPAFARKFVGDEIVIVQTETWTSAHGADVELAIPGKPGEAVGTLTLVEDGGTTTETVELAVSVRIPLVGGRIEAMIADLVGHALDVEHEVGVQWLSR
jgi:C-terminal processing protease CtpA/Prc